MKTNNRPMVKEIRYIWITKDGEEISLAFAQDGNGNGDWSVYGYKPTGKTIEVERPMYDTEYIEYLEKENQELKEHNINQRKAFAILLNEEEDKYKKEFRELNDKLLKVVESVYWELMKGVRNNMDFYNGIFFDMLLQEIKSVIEITNLEQVQDKKGKDEKEK